MVTIRSFRFPGLTLSVVNEIAGGLVLRGGWQLIVIHLALMLPMHPENERLPHMRDLCRTNLLRHGATQASDMEPTRQRAVA